MSNYLMHYGTEGMEWHKRRYQNEDGSLTPLGREHYGVGKPRSKFAESYKEEHDLNDDEYEERLKYMRSVRKTNNSINGYYTDKGAAFRRELAGISDSEYEDYKTRCDRYLPSGVYEARMSDVMAAYEDWKDDDWD